MRPRGTIEVAPDATIADLVGLLETVGRHDRFTRDRGSDAPSDRGFAVAYRAQPFGE